MTLSEPVTVVVTRRVKAGREAAYEMWLQRLLVAIIIEVILMTWVLMPQLTRHLARWIYPRTRTT